VKVISKRISSIFLLIIFSFFYACSDINIDENDVKNKVENNKAENTKIDSNNESIENAEYSTIELLNSDLERVIDW